MLAGLAFVRRILPGSLVLVLALAFGLARPGAAQQLITSAGDWGAYTYTDESGKKICYLYAEPKRKRGNYHKRSEPYAMVVRRLAGHVEEVSVTSGYPYKNEASAQLKVGSAAFRLYTQGEFAWAEDKDARALIKAMIKGQEMSVRGTSRLGTFSIDTYSLIGFTRAYKAIVKACKFGR